MNHPASGLHRGDGTSVRMAIHGGAEPQPAVPRSRFAVLAVAAGSLAGLAAGYLIGRAAVRPFKRGKSWLKPFPIS